MRNKTAIISEVAPSEMSVAKMRPGQMFITSPDQYGRGPVVWVRVENSMYNGFWAACLSTGAFYRFESHKVYRTIRPGEIVTIEQTPN